MTILIPTDSNKRFEAIISSIEENNYWAFVTLVEGQIESCEFHDRKEDVIEWIDYLIVINDIEYVWPFQEEGIKIKSVNKQKSIDEIVEAFLLDDLVDLSS